MKGKVIKMTTKELIELLKKLDPDGNIEVWFASGDSMDYETRGVEKHKYIDYDTGEPAYWLEIY